MPPKETERDLFEIWLFVGEEGADRARPEGPVKQSSSSAVVSKRDFKLLSSSSCAVESAVGPDTSPVALDVDTSEVDDADGGSELAGTTEKVQRSRYTVRRRVESSSQHLWHPSPSPFAMRRYIHAPWTTGSVLSTLAP